MERNEDMRSKVTSLLDLAAAVIPEELRRWRVTEQEIDGELARLSAVHAREREADQVREGDGVVCRGESGAARWNRPVLLFYPGYGLCERALEDALPGMRKGECGTVSAAEGEVRLTVLKILRGREPFPLCDDLVRLERIEGVETVAEYRRWYREKKEAQRRRECGVPIGRRLIQELKERSEVLIDGEEETRWATDWADHLYAGLAATGEGWKERSGIDPARTDGQIRERFVAGYRKSFRNWVLFQAFLEAAGLDLEVLRRQGMQALTERTGRTEGEILERRGRSSVDMGILAKAAEQTAVRYAEEHLDEILEE